jgi:hypothetical protein
VTWQGHCTAEGRDLDRFYTLAGPFIGHPGRAFAVAAAALLVGVVNVVATRHGRAQSREASRWPWFVLFVAWAAFGTCEARARSYVRLDLTLSWPAVLIVTLACVWVWMRGIRRPRTADKVGAIGNKGLDVE